jgi:carboxymethylenebutenolidase
MRGYLVQPTKPGPAPAVLVVHENRGLNPHIEDVARRLASEGFLALAPDGLAPVGGYPGNDDDGKDMQAKLNPVKLWTDMKNSALYLKSHAMSNGKLGITGFCWGGGVTNSLTCALGSGVQAAAPFYGDTPAAEQVANIKAPLLLHFAENDPRINAMWPPYEAALKANKVSYQSYTYAGTQHGFNNNSTPRYVEAAAKLAWERTLALFKTNLI